MLTKPVDDLIPGDRVISISTPHKILVVAHVGPVNDRNEIRVNGVCQHKPTAWIIQAGTEVLVPTTARPIPPAVTPEPEPEPLAAVTPIKSRRKAKPTEASA